jgi:hypothetical protein
MTFIPAARLGAGGLGAKSGGTSVPNFLAPLKDRLTVIALALLGGLSLAVLAMWAPKAGEARSTLPPAAEAPPAPDRLAGLAPNLSEAMVLGRTVEIGVFGDSFGDGIWWALTQQLRGDARFRLHQFSQRSTGFAGWADMTGDFRAKLDRQPIDAAIISFGANDTHGLTIDGHHVEFMSDAWRQVVGARLDAVVALLRERGIQVYWVGLPRMRQPAFEAKARALNLFYASRMQALAVPFVDTVFATTDRRGQYADHLVNPDTGQPMLARAGDGIHMSMNGYRLLTEGLARHLVRRATAARADGVRQATAQGATTPAG